MLELLKDMKKIEEDAKKVTMQHPKGHSLTIVLSKLPAIQREAIKRLPLYDGGEVKGVHKSSMDERTGKWAGESKAGEMIRNSDIKPQANEKAKDEHNRVLGEIKSMPNPKLKGLAKGGMAHYDEGSKDAPVSSDDAKPPVTVNVNPPVSQAGPGSNGIQQEAGKTLGGVSQGMQAIQGQAPIQAQIAQASVPAIEANMLAQKKIADDMQTSRNTVDTAANRLLAYQQANPLDQNQYIKNMPGGQKALTAIGLLAGGFTQGFHGGSNAAADFLNTKIAQNIDQQKQNFQNERNVFGAFHEAFGDDNIAATLATANAKERMANEINLAGQRQGTAQAKVNTQAAAAKFLMESQDLRQKAAGMLGDKYRSQGQPIPQRPEDIQPVSGQKQPNNGQNGSGIQNVNYQILKPGAEKDVANRLKYDDSISDQDKAEIPGQMSAASQAEKGLLALQNDQTFERLVEGEQNSGISGYLHRHVSPGAIGGIGAAVGTGLGALVGGAKGAGIGGGLGYTAGAGLGEGLQHLTNTDINKRFESDKSRLAGILSSALPGRGDTFFQKLLDDNTPEYKDSPKTLERKRNAIRDFIIEHVTTDALKRNHFSYK